MHRILDNKQKDTVEVFNIGTGRGVSVLELIHAFEASTGVKLNYQTNNELGWKAETSLEDTLRSAWDWQLKLRENGIQ